MCYTSVLIFNILLSICVELALQVLLVIRVLKRFLTMTLINTAQVDDIVLHVCFESHWIIEYMR